MACLQSSSACEVPPTHYNTTRAVTQPPCANNEAMNVTATIKALPMALFGGGSSEEGAGAGGKREVVISCSPCPEGTVAKQPALACSICPPG